MPNIRLQSAKNVDLEALCDWIMIVTLNKTRIPLLHTE